MVGGSSLTGVSSAAQATQVNRTGVTTLLSHDIIMAEIAEDCGGGGVQCFKNELLLEDVVEGETLNSTRGN